jgi:hypothetical protein
MALAMQDPPRRMVTRYLRWFAARRARTEYLALYHLNVASDDRRRALVEGGPVGMALGAEREETMHQHGGTPVRGFG